MNYRVLLLTAATLVLISCDKQAPGESTKVALKEQPTSAPSIAYEPIQVTNDAAGPFFISRLDDQLLLAYQGRSGTMNLLENLPGYSDARVYVAIEKAYAFGPHRYVLVVSTGENGMSCPATTYALSFDSKRELVDGHTSIDGCTEVVESLADGNRLTIKKDGQATTIYNGVIQ